MKSAEVWRVKLKEALPSALFDEPLSRRTTFRIGGPADAYVEPRDAAEVRALFAIAREFSLPVFMLGWGSNLLVRDGGLRALVCRLRGDFEKVEFPGGALVRAGAGVRVPQLVSLCAERGLAGTEPLVGVPGTVGGALVMNAGTREGEIGALVREVEIFDVEASREAKISAAQLHFEYRRSNLENRVVLGGLLELKAGDKRDIITRVQAHQQRRLQTQPIHTFNVGSIFKNPPGKYVAKLIEEAGLKGAERGGARISPMHANFIENFSQASAEDVLALVALARERVAQEFGVELELEMKVVGQA